jgi:calcineurin-like phosphoesterase family protein
MKTFLVADTHFGHLGVCKFTGSDGVSKLRPWNDPFQMDQDMIAKWNSVVGPKDKVYHLGDVLINKKAFPTLEKLNGDKVLIKGNHDIFKLEEYVKYFRDIRAYHVMNNFILSHVPVHPDSKGRFAGNIHGHLHDRRVMKDNKIDPWYHCVSVEHLDYTPILFDDLMERIKKENASLV